MNIWKVSATLVMGINLAYAAELPTNFTNIGSISNTRHNLTQNTFANGVLMNGLRNN